MKKLIALWSVVALLIFSGCNSHKEKETVQSPAIEQVKTLEMNADTLNARIINNITKEIATRQSKVSDEAFTVLGDTRKLLDLIQSGKKEDAIDFGHKLIGKLEVLLTKNPSLSFIPVNADYKVNELVTDINTVRKIVEKAKEAMNEGYYQEAQKILESLHSEIVINSYYLPTATYPDAIKVAVALLEENKQDDAAAVLQSVMGTIIIENTVLPLPVLKAEQMIKEASNTDAKDHTNADKVLNLLDNAKYQLSLAEEMGYGKQDKEYKGLLDDIKALKKSVKSKSDSKNAFDSLKVRVKKFKDRLFPQGEQENRTGKTGKKQ